MFGLNRRIGVRPLVAFLVGIQDRSSYSSLSRTASKSLVRLYYYINTSSKLFVHSSNALNMGCAWGVVFSSVAKKASAVGRGNDNI